jgi:hypothetical protein
VRPDFLEADGDGVEEVHARNTGARSGEAPSSKFKAPEKYQTQSSKAPDPPDRSISLDACGLQVFWSFEL